MIAALQPVRRGARVKTLAAQRSRHRRPEVPSIRLLWSFVFMLLHLIARPLFSYPSKTPGMWGYTLPNALTGVPLVARLEIRRQRWAQTRAQTFRQKEAAEKQRGVHSVARQRVPEKGQAGNVAGREACAGV